MNKEYYHQYYEKNKAHHRELAKKYYEEHKDQINAQRQRTKLWKTDKYKQYQREYAKTHKDKELLWRTKSWLKMNYGITLEEYNTKLNSQMGVCAICYKSTKRTLSVDHNHTTGKIRGLLCHNCNVALGLLKEDKNILNRMIDYLDEYELN